MALFESYERRIGQITPVLAKYGIASLEEAKKLTDGKGVDVYGIVKGIQTIAFENACWAYILGAAIAIKKGQKKAVDIAVLAGRRHAGFLHSRLGGGRSQGGHRARQPGLHAAEGRDQVLRLFGGPRILRRRRGRHRPRPQRQQGAQRAPARDPQRPGQGRGPDHQPGERLHLRADQVRLRLRQAEHRARDRLLQGREGQGALLWRRRRARGRGHQSPRGRGRVHHRQFHQPDPLPASGGRHLQEGMRASRARSTSRWPAAAARVAPCIPTTWPPVPPPTV